MILQTLAITVLDGQKPFLEAALCDVRQWVFTIPGYRDLSVAQGVERPSTYLVQVRRERLEELTASVRSDHFEHCWAPVKDFLAAPLVLARFVE